MIFTHRLINDVDIYFFFYFFLKIIESEASLVDIRDQICAIEYLPRETLKYLLQHLIR